MISFINRDLGHTFIVRSRWGVENEPACYPLVQRCLHEPVICLCFSEKQTDTRKSESHTRNIYVIPLGYSILESLGFKAYG